MQYAFIPILNADVSEKKKMPTFVNQNLYAKRKKSEQRSYFAVVKIKIEKSILREKARLENFL